MVFKINDTLYAVNGSIINTIFVLEQPVTHVPMTNNHVHGIINVRGDVVPVVDMRVLFGMSTSKENCDGFTSMLEQRKEDHRKWVLALRESIKNNVDFKLATSPHGCAFGKWYDMFKSDNIEIEHIFRQIDEPHQMLHECAAMLHEQRQTSGGTGIDEETQKAIEVTIETYMPTLIGLLTQLQECYKNAFRQMVIVLQHENVQIGILVDEVVEVVDIENVFSLREDTTTHRSRFVYGVGSIPEYEKDILMLDVDAVIKNN